MYSVKGLRYNLGIYAASDIMKRTTPILLVRKLHIFASKGTVNFSKSMCIKISAFIFLNLSCLTSRFGDNRSLCKIFGFISLPGVEVIVKTVLL